MLTLAGVLGFPVGHSRSPAMMNAAFAELGIPWRYLKLPIPPVLFEQTVRALPGSGFAGANVTIPHKAAAYAVADERTPAVEAIGAANTLSFREGRIAADNTDAAGFLDALGRPPPATALVLGAGGAARAVVWALRDRGAEVSIWNRTSDRARNLARDLGVRAVERPEPAALVVNATSVGLDAAAGEAETLSALGLAGAEPPELLVDLAYGAEPTALCRWAARRGSHVVEGREVLVRQGALSLEQWTGRDAPVEAMRRATASGRVRPVR